MGRLLPTKRQVKLYVLPKWSIPHAHAAVSHVRKTCQLSTGKRRTLQNILNIYYFYKSRRLHTYTSFYISLENMVQNKLLCVCGLPGGISQKENLDPKLRDCTTQGLPSPRARVGRRPPPQPANRGTFPTSPHRDFHSGTKARQRARRQALGPATARSPRGQALLGCSGLWAARHQKDRRGDVLWLPVPWRFPDEAEPVSEGTEWGSRAYWSGGTPRADPTPSRSRPEPIPPWEEVRVGRWPRHAPLGPWARRCLEKNTHVATAMSPIPGPRGRLLCGEASASSGGSVLR